MQTLLDPFELAPVPGAPAEGLRASAAGTAARQPSIEIEFDLEAVEPPKAPPGPDSSGRLRCWCSEND
jgi:hypothetical protein